MTDNGRMMARWSYVVHSLTDVTCRRTEALRSGRSRKFDSLWGRWREIETQGSVETLFRWGG